MKRSVIFLFLLGLSGLAFAQKPFSITGTVTDEHQQPLMAATVTLMQAQDSTLVTFAITKPDGRFKLDKIGEGDYYCQVSFIGYGTQSEAVRFFADSGAEKKLSFELQPSEDLLESVEITSERIPMAVGKDTITYDAKAFKTVPNAVVEDLLKKLPGVEVERDGTIRANGEEVERVLVDGKEFFGDDPTMATRNLPAEAIDKVKVYDKQSDFAEFSGIKDGNEQKTINLELKEDHKTGQFGSLTGGYGTDDRHELKANVNRFGTDKQLSLIGNHNNINEQGFSLNDYINFMGGLQSMMSGGGGGVSMQIGNGDVPLNMGMSDGQLMSTNGGINFNQQWSKDHDLSSNYMFSRIDNRIARNSSRTNFLQDGSTFASDENTLRLTESYGHLGNVRWKYAFNKKTQLRFNTRLSLFDGSVESTDNNTVFDAEGNRQNDTFNQNSSEGNRYSIAPELVFRKRFGKPGRTLSTSLTATFGNDESEGNINTVSNFYDESSTVTEENRQFQQNENRQFNYGSRISYTEPLGKSKFLELSAERNIGNDAVDKRFFDLSETDSRTLNEDLSAQYDRTYSFNQAGVKFSLNKEKVDFSTGVNYQFSELEGDLILQEQRIRQSFRQWLPWMRLSYELGTGKNVTLGYKSRLQEPTLEQLQPIVNNTNPLNIYIGNENLRPELRHEADLNFLLFDQFSFTNFFFFVSAIYTEDRIINSQRIDEDLRQVTRPINIDSDWMINGTWSFGRPIKPLGIKSSIRHRMMYNHSFLFLNNEQDVVDRWNHDISFQLEKLDQEVLTLAGGVRFEYNQTTYSKNKVLNQDFLNRTWFAEVSLNLKDKWVLSQTLDYTEFSNEDFGSQPDLAIWRADVSYFFMKNNRGELKLSAFDLLNQNVGVNRNSSANFIETERVNSLGRYFLLGFTYKLSKFGNDSGIKIENKRF